MAAWRKSGCCAVPVPLAAQHEVVGRLLRRANTMSMQHADEFDRLLHLRAAARMHSEARKPAGSRNPVCAGSVTFHWSDEWVALTNNIDAGAVQATGGTVRHGFPGTMSAVPHPGWLPLDAETPYGPHICQNSGFREACTA